MLLRPMTDGEFPAYREHVVAAFAEEQVAAGAWGPERAHEESARSFEQMLPQGAGTPGHLLLVADDDDGRVGVAWLALEHPRGMPDTAFLNDIEVDEARRGQGLGRALLEAVEQEVVRNGRSGLALNVHGPNTVARRLYERTGYEVTTMQLRKALG